MTESKFTLLTVKALHNHPDLRIEVVGQTEGAPPFDQFSRWLNFRHPHLDALSPQMLLVANRDIQIPRVRSSLFMDQRIRCAEPRTRLLVVSLIDLVSLHADDKSAGSDLLVVDTISHLVVQCGQGAPFTSTVKADEPVAMVYFLHAPETIEFQDVAD